MRGTLSLIIVSILLAVLTIPVLSQSRSETVETVTITLTKTQVDFVKTWQSSSNFFPITLTDKQINIIATAAMKRFDLEGVPRVEPKFKMTFAHLREGNTVILRIEVPQNYDVDNPRQLISVVPLYDWQL